MTYEQKPGDFLLFRNDKDGNEKRPDYTGTGLSPEGTPVQIACWLKEGKRGKFMACRMAPKEHKSRETPVSDDADNEDIPF